MLNVGKMIKVKVLSKPEFNDYFANRKINDTNVEELKDLALISINDTHGQWSVSWFDNDHSNVLRLWFDDVEHNFQLSPTNKESCRAFTEKQAHQVIKFAKDNRNKNFIVHCSAGISRSGAVGTFLNGYCQGDWEAFKKMNPYISPNARVNRMLNNIVQGYKNKKE